MIKSILGTTFFAMIAAVLQSTLLSHIALYRAVPDLALGIVVYSAYINGSMTGQLAGFFSGIFLDFLSAAPLGLNALIRTLTGALAGLMRGAFFLDLFFLPMALCALATLLKAVIMFFLNLLLSGTVPAYPLMAPTLWIELAFNTVTAPFLFFLLKKLKFFMVERRDR
jgi:rod shape-determining protein MreD